MNGIPGKQGISFSLFIHGGVHGFDGDNGGRISESWFWGHVKNLELNTNAEENYALAA
jgi:hypothetical protein